jgi:flagellar hook-basal body complex protein FliE
MSGFDILGPLEGVKRPYGLTNPLGGDKALPQTGPDQVDGSKEFASSLSDALQGVRDLQLDSRDKARALAAGEPIEVHDLMISMGKSEVAFNMMLEVRNKLLEAWQTLQRSVS